MIFTLEALEAKHGDALLLHYGEVNSPELIVIDGGPRGVYRNRMQPRLQEIKQSRSPHDRLQIRLLMVSHIDDDHIRGVLDLTNDLAEALEEDRDPPYEIQTLWHNSFDDILDNRPEALFTALEPAVMSAATTGIVPNNLPISRHGALLVASVPQGRDLRNNAAKLNLGVNEPFAGLVIAPKHGKTTVPLGSGLSITVLGPAENRLEELQEEWDKQINKLGLAQDAEAQAIAAAFVDKSVFNLASIVVLAESGNRQMLLTGDARGDDIIEGLSTAGFLEDGKFHVDLFKIPHHGSDHNVAIELFRQVTADHYIFSGDGKYGNPEIATLKMLSEARGQDNYTMYFTNEEERLVSYFEQETVQGRNYAVVFRSNTEPSLKIDLGEHTS